MQQRGYQSIKEDGATRIQALCKGYAVRRHERMAREAKEKGRNLDDEEEEDDDETFQDKNRTQYR